MAFCSLSYQFLLGTRISRHLSEGILLYPLSLGFFILGMGLGSAFWYRKPRDLGTIIRALLGIELLLTMMGALTILLFDLQVTWAIWGKINPVYMGLALSFLIGLLSGQELPLIFHLCSAINLAGKTVRRIIFFDYVASFFASLTFVLLLNPSLGLLRTGFLVAAFNLLILLLILNVGILKKARPSRAYLVMTGLLISGFLLIPSWLSEFNLSLIEDRLKIKYNDRLIYHHDTHYSQIDIFIGRVDFGPVKASKPEILRNPKKYFLYGYLNESIQFYNILGNQGDPYHTYLIDPFMKLLPNLKKVVILGGGDGLPAKQLIKYPGIESITMVDLDGEWCEFARTNPFMKLNHHNALNHRKLKIVHGDAFKWAMKTREKYDALFVDFPEDDNLALLRTLSIQFFNDIRRLLTPQGVFVVQNDIEGVAEKAVVQSIFKSIQSSGLHGLYSDSTNTNELKHTVNQLVGFKKKEMRTLFIKKYVNYKPPPNILRKVKGKDLLLKYRIPKYSDKTQVMSFYDPYALKYLLGALFEDVKKVGGK